MQLSLYTWNSLAINDGTNFTSWIPVGQLVNLTANGITVPRSTDFPYLSGTVLGPHTFTINVKIPEAAVASNLIPQNRELLKGYFDVTDKTRHNLIAKDILDSNRQWYLTGYPIRLIENNPGIYTITLQVETPIWRVVTALTDTWNIVASGETRTITNIGNTRALPKYSLTPVLAKASGYLYRRCVVVLPYNTVTMTIPMELTDGLGLDTATLVGAGKMLASGDDLRVWVDGQEVDRWLADMNSAKTKIWVNLSLQAGVYADLETPIAGAGSITTITFRDNDATRQFLTALGRARNKIVWSLGESFLFTGVDVPNCQLTGVTRTVKGSSIAAHSAGDTFFWLEHDVCLLYGDPSASTPSPSDRDEPIFDLSTSTNYEWHYTELYDSTAPRPGAWTPKVLKSGTGKSRVFTGDENAYVNPATVLGVALVGSNSEFDVYKAIGETGVVVWSFYHPAGLEGIAYSGKKYAFDTTVWPAIAGFQYLVENVTWQTVATEPVPIVFQSWEPISQTLTWAEAYNSVRFTIDGTINPVTNNLAMIQFSSLVLTIAYDPMPAFIVNGEENICYFDLKLSNTTTGEYLKVKAPVKLGATMTIDCENKLAYVSDGASVNVKLSTDRAEWLSMAGTPINSGASVMKYEDAGTVSVTLITEHRDRNL
jgi:hypothetical protein